MKQWSSIDDTKFKFQWVSRAMIITTEQRSTNILGLLHPLSSLVTTNSTPFHGALLGISRNWSIYWVGVGKFCRYWNEWSHLLNSVCKFVNGSLYLPNGARMSYLLNFNFQFIFVTSMNASWKPHLELLDIYQHCRVFRFIGHASFDEVVVNCWDAIIVSVNFYYIYQCIRFSMPLSNIDLVLLIKSNNLINILLIRMSATWAIREFQESKALVQIAIHTYRINLIWVHNFIAQSDFVVMEKLLYE